MRRLLTFILLFTITTIAAQNTITISIIDFYGNRTISTELLDKTLMLSKGEINTDTLSREKYEVRLKAIPGVKQAHINLVCCDEKTKGWILFAGITESNDTIAYRREPKGKDSLPASILQLGLRFNDAMMQAIQNGNGLEESPDGYALMNDSASKAIQLQFIPVARDNYALLKKVLYNSSSSVHRGFAAQMMAYAADKKSVINDLMYTILDHNETVRNNATRALALIAEYSNRHPDKGLKIPAAPFIKMLNSPVWTDRNKGLMLLRFLTDNRDVRLLQQLKTQALPSLIEMANWKSDGHAFTAYIITGRLAGMKDEEIFQAFSSEKKETELKKWATQLNR